jgi:hypothetical protein
MCEGLEADSHLLEKIITNPTPLPLLFDLSVHRKIKVGQPVQVVRGRSAHIAQLRKLLKIMTMCVKKITCITNYLRTEVKQLLFK